MKSRVIIIALVVAANVTYGQWLPVTVNTNTGIFKPINIGSGISAGITNAYSVGGSSNLVSISNKTLIVRFDTNSVSSSILAGTIIQFGGTNLPTGYLLCDGSSVTTNTYHNLFAAIGTQWGGSGANFNVPDLRGQFLRGWSGTSTNSVDPDVYSRTARYAGGATSNNVGSYQSDTNQAHSHLYTAGNQSAWTFSNGSPYSPAYSAANSGTSSSGGSEARPKNAYVMYCIKY
ncbi:MAG: tail fiber protein [bacterium]